MKAPGSGGSFPREERLKLWMMGRTDAPGS